MMKRVLVLLGHPDKESYCGAIAEAYVRGARAAGAEVRYVQLGELEFDPILHKGYKVIQELEPDLKKVQEDITWAQHIVLVYPTWWGGPPALVTGFIERAMLPGYGFKYWPNSPFWKKLLKGRTGHLITTIDSPRWYHALLVGSPGYTMLKHATFRFCGIWPVRYTMLSKIRFRTDTWREKKIKDVEYLGRRLK